MDLCQLHGRTLLVVCDYFSNYIEVERLTTTTSRSVARVLSSLFARHGVPDVLVSDNGPQFVSAELASFAKKWKFEHVTSSPHYAQSNGKAENAVKTVKRLFTKCKEDGTSEFLALLDWRNTPSEGSGVSPAQRLMGRRCKTLLPMATSLLQPRHSIAHDHQAIVAAKAKQSFYYDRHTLPLSKLESGDSVRIRLPGEKSWTSGICHGYAGPRSYNVCVGGNIYGRNRRDIRSSTSQEPQLEVDLEGAMATEMPPRSLPSSPGMSQQPTVSGVPIPESEVTCDIPVEKLPAEASLSVRRSKRARKANVRLRDYITG